MALLHFLVDRFFVQQIGNNGWLLCRGHIITIITGAKQASRAEE